jgi:hypothetical protein
MQQRFQREAREDREEPKRQNHSERHGNTDSAHDEPRTK